MLDRTETWDGLRSGFPSAHAPFATAPHRAYQAFCFVSESRAAPVVVRHAARAGEQRDRSPAGQIAHNDWYYRGAKSGLLETIRVDSGGAVGSARRRRIRFPCRHTRSGSACPDGSWLDPRCVSPRRQMAWKSCPLVRLKNPSGAPPDTTASDGDPGRLPDPEGPQPVTDPNRLAR